MRERRQSENLRKISKKKQKGIDILEKKMYNMNDNFIVKEKITKEFLL